MLQLTETPLFRGMTEAEIRGLLACLSAGERRYARGERILTAGEPCPWMGLVLSGRVLVELSDAWGNDSVLGAAGEGEVFAEAGTQHVYTQPGGGYEIVTQVLPAASMQSVVRSLSGFDASALRVYESGSRSRPVWQFAWYAASDEGGRLYRCKVISEGAHCYALTFSAPEGSGTAYDTTAAELFSSMELQPA